MMSEPQWHDIRTGQPMAQPSVQAAHDSALAMVNGHINRLPQGSVAECQAWCTSVTPPQGPGQHGDAMPHYQALAAEVGRTNEARFVVCRDYWRTGNASMHRATMFWATLSALSGTQWGSGWSVYFFRHAQQYNNAQPSRYFYASWWEREWDAPIWELGAVIASTIPGGWVGQTEDAPPSREAWLDSLRPTHRAAIVAKMGWDEVVEPPPPDPGEVTNAALEAQLLDIERLLVGQPLPPDWPTAEEQARAYLNDNWCVIDDVAEEGGRSASWLVDGWVEALSKPESATYGAALWCLTRLIRWWRKDMYGVVE
jgi:hypothetical protein